MILITCRRLAPDTKTAVVPAAAAVAEEVAAADETMVTTIGSPDGPAMNSGAKETRMPTTAARRSFFSR